MTIPMSFVKTNYTYIKSAIGLIPKLRVLIANKNRRKKLLLTAFMGAAWADRLKLGGFLCKLLERMGAVEPVWEYCFSLVKSVILYRRGLLTDALRNNQRILSHEAALSSDQWRSVGLSCSHNAPWLLGDIEASEKYMVEFASLAEKYDSAFARGYALRLSAYSKHQALDFYGILKLMEGSAGAFLKDGNPTMACVVNITRYLWETELKGSALSYAQMAANELKKLQSLNSGQGFMEVCRTITGALFKEGEEYEQAEVLLNQALRVSHRKHAMQSVCGSLLHLADLYYRMNSLKKERKTLKRFGKIVSEYGFEYFREMNYTSLVRVCARCVEAGIYINKMYRIMLRYFGVEGADRMMGNPSETSANPQQFIGGYAPPEQETIPIRAEFFGAFRIIADGVQIVDSDWKTRKTSGILKYILLSGSKAVSRDALALTFWPGSDTKAAHTSLRAALYELRKTLARFDMAFESENALLVETKSGFALREGAILQTDVNEFSELYRWFMYENLPSDEAKQALMRMTRLYQGDFLPGEPYGDWVVLERERYKAMFAEAAHHLSALYLKEQEYDPAQTLLTRLLAMDPLDETACGLLIHLYERTDQSTRAYTLKRQFTKRFEAEMGLTPELKSFL